MRVLSGALVRVEGECLYALVGLKPVDEPTSDHPATVAAWLKLGPCAAAVYDAIPDGYRVGYAVEMPGLKTPTQLSTPPPPSDAADTI